MAKTFEQVKWSGANTTTVTASSFKESDAVTINTASQGASISFYVSHPGTPAANDWIDVSLLMTSGDPLNDPDSADVYDSPEAAPVIMRLDTTQANPIQGTVNINHDVKALKVRADSGAGSATLTVAAQITVNHA